MARPLIAVTDSVFPSLDPAKAALKRIDPELKMAKSAAADDILAVAHDADAVLVTYAKLTGDLLRQLTRCKVIGRFGLGVDNIDLPAAKDGHHGHLCARLLPAGSVRSRHGAAAGAGAKNPPVQSAGAGGPLGNAGGGADLSAGGPRARPHRLRQYPAQAGAQGAGVRPARDHARSQPRARRGQGARRGERELRRALAKKRVHLGACAADAADARAGKCRRLHEDEEGRAYREYRARPADG